MKNWKIEAEIIIMNACAMQFWKSSTVLLTMGGEDLVPFGFDSEFDIQVETGEEDEDEDEVAELKKRGWGAMRGSGALGWALMPDA